MVDLIRREYLNFSSFFHRSMIDSSESPPFVQSLHSRKKTMISYVCSAMVRAPLIIGVFFFFFFSRYEKIFYDLRMIYDLKYKNIYAIAPSFKLLRCSVFQINLYELQH